MKTHNFVYLFIAITSVICILVSFVLGIEVGLTQSPNEYKTDLLPVLSTIGIWVGAFATLSAVIVSLWLALKQLSMDKEILQCTLNMFIIPGHQNQACIGLSIVSKGKRPSIVNSITWHGDGTSEAMVVSKYNQNSESTPKALGYGETIQIMHTENFEKHLHEFAIKNLGGEFRKLYLSVNTTTESNRIELNDAVYKAIKNAKEC